MAVPFVPGSAGCDCSCDPCDAIVYCVAVSECCVGPKAGLAVSITEQGQPPDTGATDGAGQFCHTYTARADAAVTLTYQGCTFAWTVRFSTCEFTQPISFCWAEVAVQVVSLAGGDLTDERATWSITTPHRHYLISSCDAAPTKLRVVTGLSPGPPAVGVTGCPDDAPLMDFALACPVSGQAAGQATRCDGAPSAFLWECARSPDWCCEDLTVTVAGLPHDGDSSWTGRDPCSGLPSRGACCANCRAAADMTYANMGFRPKYLDFSADLYYWRPTAAVPGEVVPTGRTREDVSLAATLTYQCDPARNVPAWLSGAIAVSWPLDDDDRVVSVRVGLDERDNCGALAWVQVLEIQHGADPPYPVVFPLFLILEGPSVCDLVPETETTASDFYVQCCDQDSEYGLVPCDHHVDWSWSREWVGPGDAPLIFWGGRGQGCQGHYIYGTASVVGP